MMRWIANSEQGSMEQVMTAQVNALRDQMISANAQAVAEPGTDTTQQDMLQQLGRMVPRRIVYRDI